MNISDEERIAIDKIMGVKQIYSNGTCRSEKPTSEELRLAREELAVARAKREEAEHNAS